MLDPYYEDDPYERSLKHTPEPSHYAPLKNPIPAIVAKRSYVCIHRGIGEKKTEFEWVIIGADLEFKVTRCVDFGSKSKIDETKSQCKFEVSHALPDQQLN